MSDIKCPYCGCEFDIDRDDGHGCEQDVTYKESCPECDKYFMFETSILFYYTAKKADCLNDRGHDFQPTKIYPRHLAKMRCTMCGKERDPTHEERLKYNIPLTYGIDED